MSTKTCIEESQQENALPRPEDRFLPSVDAEVPSCQVLQDMAREFFGKAVYLGEQTCTINIGGTDCEYVPLPLGDEDDWAIPESVFFANALGEIYEADIICGDDGVLVHLTNDLTMFSEPNLSELPSVMLTGMTARLRAIRSGKQYDVLDDLSEPTFVQMSFDSHIRRAAVDFLARQAVVATGENSHTTNELRNYLHDGITTKSSKRNLVRDAARLLADGEVSADAQDRLVSSVFSHPTKRDAFINEVYWRASDYLGDRGRICAGCEIGGRCRASCRFASDKRAA